MATVKTSRVEKATSQSNPFIMSSGSPNPGSVVRAYSMSVIEQQLNSDQLSWQSRQVQTALADSCRRNESRIKEMNTYLSSTQVKELDKLEKCKKDLQQAMRSFQEQIPSDLRKEYPGTCTKWEDVEALMSKLQDRWQKRREQSKFGKVAHYFRRISTNINNHSNALKLLPASSEYVSVFYGSLDMILKATANYTQISESFTKSIVQINDAVATIDKRVWLVKGSITVEQLTIRLYSQIFAYLLNVIRWYTDRSAKRLLKSFNESLSEDLNSQISDIRIIAGNIKDEADVLLVADVQVTRLYVENMDQRLKWLMERDKRFEAAAWENLVKLRDEVRELQMERRTMHAEQQKLFHMLWNKFEGNVQHDSTGTLAMDLLQEGVRPPKSPQMSIEEYDETTDGSQAEETPSDKPGAPMSRGDVQLNSRNLEDHFGSDKVQQFESNRASILTESRIASGLRSFTISDESQILCICTRRHMGEDLALSTVAGWYASSARESGMPVVSYFCRLQEDEPPPHRKRETIELVALLYSMIRQLIDLLPSQLDQRRLDFGSERFEKLDGTLLTWKDALNILGELFTAIQEPVLLVVIDGIQELDDHSTEVQLKELLNLLQRQAKGNQADSARVVKLLLTTTGHSPSLNSVVDHRDFLVARAPLGTAASGRPPVARQQLMFQ